MYQIEWANGRHLHGGQTVAADTYDEATAIVIEEYPDAEIGHDGDLTEHGDRTLCWANEADSENDGGQNACASITDLDRCDACGGTIGECSCEDFSD